MVMIPNKTARDPFDENSHRHPLKPSHEIPRRQARQGRTDDVKK